MEKINELLEKLDNKVSKSLSRRLDALNDLNERLDLAKSEHDAEPTEQSEATLNQIQNYVNDVTDDLIEDLEAEIEKREEAKANPPAPETPPASNENKDGEEEEKEEKSGMSFFGVALGVALLIGTAGAYNYFSKNK